MYKEGDCVRINVEVPEINAKDLVGTITRINYGYYLINVFDDPDGADEHSYHTRKNEELSLYIDTHNHPCMIPKPIYIGIGSGSYHVCKECDTVINI